jgi:hypothetical protein
MNMKRRSGLTTLLLTIVLALPAVAQQRTPRALDFASDFQTVPVMGNVPGINGAVFQTYVAILNPTANAFPVDVTWYDGAGNRKTAMITLAAGELKTYSNFLDTVFQATGGGAVTFRAAESAGGTHNNRFILNVEVKTAGNRFGTSVPALEFAGTASRSFSPGITVDSTSRTNIGCFNQSDVANRVKVTILDNTGKVTVGTQELNLAANAWAQTGLSSIVVSGGFVQFEPAEAAVCYAVVVDNVTADGRLIMATEYAP